MPRTLPYVNASKLPPRQSWFGGLGPNKRDITNLLLLGWQYARRPSKESRCPSNTTCKVRLPLNIFMIHSFYKFLQNTKAKLPTIADLTRSFTKKAYIKFRQRYSAATHPHFNKTIDLVVDTTNRIWRTLRIVITKAPIILDSISDFAEEKRVKLILCCSTYMSLLLNKITLLLCLAALTVLFLIHFTLEMLPMSTYLTTLIVTAMPTYLLLQTFVFFTKTYSIAKYTTQNQRFWKRALMLF